MAGYFQIGEIKERPGSYFNIERSDGTSADNAINGVTAVVFRSDFGPLGSVVKLSSESGCEEIYGTEGTTDAVRQALFGGAQTIIACRLGQGGEKASLTLKGEDGEDTIVISAKYPGAREFSVTIREKLSDPDVKQCVIYSGTKELEIINFAAGKNEAQALAEAMALDQYFTVEVKNGTNSLENILQEKLEGGSDPVITTEDYANAFADVEPYMFNTICVDTEDTSVHLMLAAFVERIFEAGNLTQAVIAEKSNVDFETRIARAASYNDEKMNYVLNPKVDVSGTVLDGYQTAARIAGMMGAVSSKQSLTHAELTGFTDIYEKLTNTDVIKAEQNGCIVLTMNTKGGVWIDSAINTLVNLPDNKDDGWKKIRRVKTRFELIRRCNEITDELVGKVDNDSDGRKTIISQLKGLGSEMIAEGKLVSFRVDESSQHPAGADSCWFVIDVIDKDSAEHIYSFFKFRFSTNAD